METYQQEPTLVTKFRAIFWADAKGVDVKVPFLNKLTSSNYLVLPLSRHCDQHFHDAFNPIEVLCPSHNVVLVLEQAGEVE